MGSHGIGDPSEDPSNMPTTRFDVVPPGSQIAGSPRGCRILGLQPLIPFLQCVNWLGLRFVL